MNAKKFLKSSVKGFNLASLILFSTWSLFAAPAFYDYDGDGRSDLVVVRYDSNTPNLTWYILQSRDGFREETWGLQSGDISQFDGDYDGDGKPDITIVRRTSDPYLIWFILNSSNNTMTTAQWGLKLTDYALPQDYDGDGKTDVAVYRDGWWYILKSSDGQLHAEKFGTANDRALAGGDYDGDGKADLAVARYGQAPFPGGAIPTTLYIRKSLDGRWSGYNLGDARLTGVLTGDYDGDGKADVAVWQGNLWLWIRSSDNQAEGVRFGDPGRDKPVQADYDGDGKTDVAVYRRGTIVNPQSYFYILGSRDGFKAVQWGTERDGADANISSIRFIQPIGF